MTGSSKWNRRRGAALAYVIGAVGAVAVVGLVLIVVLSRGSSTMAGVPDNTAAFEPHLATYLDMSNFARTGALPFRPGKVVTVSTQTEGVDLLTYGMLPDSIRAESPQQVAAVALINWDRLELPAAKEGDPQRYMVMAHVSLVDPGRRLVIGRASFEGEPTEDAESHAARPAHQIVEWLQNLPRR
ncbi:MAG: hypothetical protein CMJ18_15235 [Phycisphaeraceae bacterium]|nr:hypothetical protein [Phycisphaeraceae bacterium]